MIDRILGRSKQPDETPCPRCGTLAPVTAIECHACGWDLREAYSSKVPGSYIESER